MATVVQRGPDRRWEQLGLALGALGGQFVVEQKENARRQAAAATLQRLSKGELDPIATVGELTASGMNPEDADRLVGNVFRAKEISLLERKTDADIRQTDEKIDIDRTGVEGNLQLGAGKLALDAELGRGQLQLGRDELASVERRATAQMELEERLTGARISAERKNQIFAAEQAKELEGLRQRGEQNSIKLQGAVQSFLGKEKLATDLFMDREQREFTAEENEKDRQNRLGIAKTSSAGKKTEGEVLRETRAQELFDTAKAEGFDLSRITEPAQVQRAGAIIASYAEDQPEILKDFAKQLGVDVKVVTPDGFAFDKSVGGIEQLKLRIAQKNLGKTYAKQLVADTPQYDRGSMTTRILEDADKAAFDPKQVLPPELVNTSGQVTNAANAARYLKDNFNFTRNDSTRWLKRNLPGMPVSELDNRLDEAGYE